MQSLKIKIIVIKQLSDRFLHVISSNWVFRIRKFYSSIEITVNSDQNPMRSPKTHMHIFHERLSKRKSKEFLFFVNHIKIILIFSDTETDMLGGDLPSASCVQGSDDSRNSAIRIAYRTLLRSSSLWEPRYPSLKIFLVFYCFRFSNLRQ